MEHGEQLRDLALVRCKPTTYGWIITVGGKTVMEAISSMPTEEVRETVLSEFWGLSILSVN